MILLDLRGFEAMMGLCRWTVFRHYEYLRCVKILYRMTAKTVFPCQGGILGSFKVRIPRRALLSNPAHESDVGRVCALHVNCKATEQVNRAGRALQKIPSEAG